MANVRPNPYSHKHKLAADILGNDNPKGSPTAKAMGDIGAPSGGIKKLKSIRLEHHDNGGITVHHTALKDPNKDEYDNIGKGDKSESNRIESSSAFSNPAEAHSHIGKLLGVNGD